LISRNNFRALIAARSSYKCQKTSRQLGLCPEPRWRGLKPFRTLIFNYSWWGKGCCHLSKTPLFALGLSCLAAPLPSGAYPIPLKKILGSLLLVGLDEIVVRIRPKVLFDSISFEWKFMLRNSF